MILTYKYRLKDRSAAKRLRGMATACNQVWNYCAAYQRDTEARYRAGAKPRKWASRFDLQRLTNSVGIDIGILQQSVAAVCDQFVCSRNRAKRAPRFRASFGPRRSLGWIPFKAGSRRTDGNSVIYLGKRYRWFGNARRPLPSAAKGGAFVEDALGRWWVCFQVDVGGARSHGTNAVGIDLGLKSLATLSCGHKIEAPRHYRKYECALASAQRAGNKRRTKAIHAKIANCRRDHLHKTSIALVRGHATIIVGNVSSSKLAGTRMAKSVHDVGWFTFKSMLKYKCQQAAAAYLEVNESFTTQTCSECGCIAGPKGRAGLNERRWDCPHCGASHDRDVNAARNILRLGLSAQAHADESRAAVDSRNRIGTTTSPAFRDGPLS